MDKCARRIAKKIIVCVIGFAFSILSAATVAEEPLASNSSDIDSLSSLNQIDSDEQLAILKQSVLDYAMERNANVAAASASAASGAAASPARLGESASVTAPRAATEYFGENI